MLLFVGIVIGFGIGYGTCALLAHVARKSEKSKKSAEKFNPWAWHEPYRR